MRASVLIPAALAAALLACSSGGQKEDVLHLYQMGERVPVGHLTYTVFEREWRNQLGDGIMARTPQNRFYLVRISVANTGASEAIVPELELVDDAGQSYAELTDGEGVQDWIGNTRQVGPKGTNQGYLLFDVPAKHYKLKVTGEEAKTEALVDIPLSFDSEVPDVTTPLDPDKIPIKK